MGTDESQGAGDWLIDDIQVSQFRSCLDNDLIFRDDFE
jgi:hypothetical protein